MAIKRNRGRPSKQQKEQEFAEAALVFGKPVFVDEVLELPEEKKVIEWLLKGEKTEDVARKIGKPEWWVLEIAKKSQLRKEAVNYRKELMREVMADKGPLLKEIAGGTLEIIKNKILELRDNPEAMALLSVRDLRELAAIAATVDGMERLEKGKPTQHLAITNYSSEELTVTLEKLKEEDPIFSYPQISNGSE